MPFGHWRRCSTRGNHVWWWWSSSSSLRLQMQRCVHSLCSCTGGGDRRRFPCGRRTRVVALSEALQRSGRLFFVVVFLATVACALSENFVTPAVSKVLRLRNGVVHSSKLNDATIQNAYSTKAAGSANALLAAGVVHKPFVAVSRRTTSPAQRTLIQRVLARHNATVAAFLPDNAWLCNGPLPDAAVALRQELGDQLAWIGRLPTAHRVNCEAP